VVIGLAGLIFFYIGVSMGWLYEFMGVVLGSAVVPIALCVVWSKANKWGCISGAVSGFFAGIIAWLVTTSTLNGGVINVTTSGGDFEMLAGNLASIGVGGIVSVAYSLMWPENFDFELTRAINAPASHHKGFSQKSEEKDEYDEDEKEKDSNSPPVDVQSISERGQHVMGVTDDSELDIAGLKAAFRFAAWSSVALLVVMIILIPLPLFFAQTIFGVKGLSAWVVIGIIWAFCSAITVVIYPLIESREAILMVTRGVVKDIFSRGSGKFVTAPVIQA